MKLNANAIIHLVLSFVVFSNSFCQQFTVNSAMPFWQNTGLTISAGSSITITPTSSSLGSFVATNGPENGNLVNTVVYNTGTGNQVSLNGNRYNSNNTWFSNIGTVPSGPHAWTGLAPNHTGYVLRFIGFLDANGNGQFNFGIDQYLGVINQALTINPTISGQLYMAFYDDGPYNDNSGVLTFLVCPDTTFIANTVCDSFYWPATSQVYTQTGSYVHQVTNQYGCDSVTVLNLTVNQSAIINESVSSCEEFLWPVNGQTYNNSGVYTEVLQTQFGCDSTLILELTINESITSTETLSVCDSYTWAVNGQTYTSSGTYTEVLQTQFGCDSTVNLSLTIYLSNSSQTQVTACDSFTWNGQTYNQSGIYSYQTINMNGCDSLATLNLTINNSVQTQEIVRVCNFEDVKEEVFELSTIHGCDSTHIVIYEHYPLSQLPLASFSTAPTTTVMLPPGIIQTFNSSQNATSFTWDFGDATGLTTAEQPTHTYQNEGQYQITLVANNETNCPDTSVQLIIVQEDLLVYVPNAFSPDGNEFNNVFLPVINGDFDPYNYTLLIFNRWGEVVFESRNAEIGWDGTYNGRLAQDGVFTWKLILKSRIFDKPKEFFGHVNLIR